VFSTNTLFQPSCLAQCLALCRGTLAAHFQINTGSYPQLTASDAARQPIDFVVIGC
jgi:hypothetical protein